MATIKINDNNNELTNLSRDKVDDQIMDIEIQNPDFKVETSMLDTSETLKPIVIKNLS